MQESGQSALRIVVLLLWRTIEFSGSESLKGAGRASNYFAESMEVFGLVRGDKYLKLRQNGTSSGPTIA